MAVQIVIQLPYNYNVIYQLQAGFGTYQKSEKAAEKSGGFRLCDEDLRLHRRTFQSYRVRREYRGMEVYRLCLVDNQVVLPKRTTPGEQEQYDATLGLYFYKTERLSLEDQRSRK